MSAQHAEAADRAPALVVSDQGARLAVPLVSVLTPSLNQGRWLDDALESVRRQTYPSIEHIVMDGGSTDDSLPILEAAPNVIWRSEPDSGQSNALAKAFALSGGEIIGWINADDAYFDCTVIADVVRFFDAHPRTDVVYGHAVLANGEGRVLHAIWVPPYSYRLLRIHNYIIQPAVFMRRRALADRFVDERYGYRMDRELWLRLARDRAFSRIPRILAIDRHHADRKSLTRPDLGAADLARLKREYAIPMSLFSRLAMKASRIVFRFAGVRAAAGVSNSSLAFAGTIDRRSVVLARQIALRRRMMRDD